MKRTLNALGLTWAARRLGSALSGMPLLAWLLGGLAAVLLEGYAGPSLAGFLGLSKVPVLLGLVNVFKALVASWQAMLAGAGFSARLLGMLRELPLIPASLAFLLLIYALPITVVARVTGPVANRVSGWLLKVHVLVAGAVHLGLLYAVLHIWTDISDYRLLTLKLTLIAIMVTLSLNIINGYMGEFSCSHPGFIALGAYATSLVTVIFFAKDKLFGEPLLPPALGPFMFPVALIVGGLVAAFGALFVAIPSFRTRGDYLAIISLAFMFIIKSLIENLEVVGGPRGLSGQPDYATLPTVFGWTVACVWIINNFVRSTLGKSLNAVRDNEMAADAMTVNTRRTKMTAFLFSAFWAGVAGGLFAHVLRYVNPGTFSLQKLAEVLAMVYFGGLNSVYGSIVGAVSLSFLGEALRPLELFKWIIIPLLLILVMIFRPTGLIAFREFDPTKVMSPRTRKEP